MLERARRAKVHTVGPERVWLYYLSKLRHLSAELALIHMQVASCPHRFATINHRRVKNATRAFRPGTFFGESRRFQGNHENAREDEQQNPPRCFGFQATTAMCLSGKQTCLELLMRGKGGRFAPCNGGLRCTYLICNRGA